MNAVRAQVRVHEGVHLRVCARACAHVRVCAPGRANACTIAHARLRVRTGAACMHVHVLVFMYERA